MGTKMKKCLVLFLAASSCLLAQPLPPSTSRTIVSDTMKDLSGQALIGSISVSLNDPAYVFNKSVATTDGTFSLSLYPGNYSVTIHSTTFNQDRAESWLVPSSVVTLALSDVGSNSANISSGGLSACSTTPPTAGYRQSCYDTAGAIWTCTGTCTVAGNWVAAAGSGSFTALTGHATSTASGGATDVVPFYDVTVLPTAASAVARRLYRNSAATTKNVCLTAGDSGGSAMAICVVNYAGTAYNVINSDLVIGTAAGTVAAGDDSRLSNSRAPTAHASSHQNGGSDEVATTTAAANAIPKAGSGGTLADAWHSSNVPLKNGTNAYTGTQDSHGATKTLPHRTGTGSPVSRDSCATLGETYFQSDAAAGSNTFACTTVGTPGTWSLQGGGGTGGSVFASSTATASTGISGTAAAPILSLSDQSTKSPTRFEIALTASTAVTSVTVNNKTAGAKFSVAWTQPATNMVGVTWGASVSNTPCAVSQVASSTTTQLFEVGADGTTVSAVGCPSTDTVFAGTESAEDSTTTSGNFKVTFSSTAHTGVYYGNGSANRHIMPRTAGSTDQLSIGDLADGTAAGIIALFSGCTGTKVPQADGTCGTAATMPGAGPGFARVTSGGAWDTTAPISVADLPGDYICADASGSSTDYTCTPTNAPAAWVVGERYGFVVGTTNTAATGKPTFAPGSLPAKQIVKVQGGVSTALLAGDNCAGQYVEMRYDGAHLQMMSPTCAVAGTVDLATTQALTNKTLDGVTPTVMGYVDPTSSIQSQLNGKQASITATTRPFNVILTGSGTGGVITTSDGSPVFYNMYGQTMTFTVTSCLTDSATADRVQLTNGGNAMWTDNSSAGFDCSSSRGAPTLSGTYKAVTTATQINATVVTAGGASKLIFISGLYTVPVI